MLKVTVLGCGSSGGVPLMGCVCEVCRSPDPKNKRLRASIHVMDGDTSILIDTSPDMRRQCLAHEITKVDAIIFTHPHADHLHGIDDTRSFNHALNAPLPIYSDAWTLGHIREKFAYTLLPPKPANHPGDWGWYRPCLDPVVIEPLKPFTIGRSRVLATEQKHGGGKSLGLRFGGFAYSTDVNGMTEETLAALEGIDTWIVDCLRYEEAPTHAHLAMTLDWIARIKPRRAYLTHMSHGLDYNRLTAELPEGVFPAYDGLMLEIA